MTDWTDPKWSNPLVHVAANGSFVPDHHIDADDETGRAA